MDLLISLLFWVHLVSLAVGGAAVFGIPVVGSKMPTATAETRPLLFSILHRLSTIGRAALALLLISGPLLVWLKFGGFGGLSFWFWVKMVLVLLILATVIYAGINSKKAEAGDRAAAMRTPMIGMTAVVLYLCIVAAAVLTFG